MAKVISNSGAVNTQFRVVKQLTRALLKLSDNTPYYLKIEQPIFQAEQVKNPKKDSAGNVIPPPFIIFAINLEDNASVQLVANDVLKSELEKQYKENDYVGKCFEVIKNTKAEGKRYNTFGITEIEPVEEPTFDSVVHETATEVPVAEAKKTKK